MTTPTEIILTNANQTPATQLTGKTNNDKIIEVLTAFLCLTFFPAIYLIGNWFFN